MSLTLKYLGEGNFRAIYPAKCADMEPGSIGAWSKVEVRSAKSHRHYFAAVHEAWMNLPPEAADRFPSSEHLRKWALIQAGYCKVTPMAFRSNAEAIKACAFIGSLDEYSECGVHESAVIVKRADSQSVPSMGRATFNASKQDVLRVLSELIGAPVTEDMAQAA